MTLHVLRSSNFDGLVKFDILCCPILYCCVSQVVASLQAQLEQRRREAEQRDVLFQNLSQETQNLKNQLVTVSSRCQSLETQAVVG